LSSYFFISFLFIFIFSHLFLFFLSFIVHIVHIIDLNPNIALLYLCIFTNPNFFGFFYYFSFPLIFRFFYAMIVLGADSSLSNQLSEVRNNVQNRENSKN